ASGAPINITSNGAAPGYTVTGIGGAQLNRMITGSEDVAPRVVFTCNPNLSHGDKTIDRFFDTSCFAPAQKGSNGMDSGYNQLRGSGLVEWSATIMKNVKLSEKGARLQLRLEAYNVFNHAEWGGVNTVAQFNAAGVLINTPTQLGGTGGR